MSGGGERIALVSGAGGERRALDLDTVLVANRGEIAAA